MKKSQKEKFTKMTEITIKLQDPEKFTDEEIEKILPYIDELEKIFAELREYAIARCEDDGKVWKGMKFKNGMARRLWRADGKSAAAEWLQNNGYSELIKVEPRGITEIERKIGKDVFSRNLNQWTELHVTKPSLHPTK